MSNNTENYSMIMPEPTDRIRISDINKNTEFIDKQLRRSSIALTVVTDNIDIVCTGPYIKVQNDTDEAVELTINDMPFMDIEPGTHQDIDINTVENDFEVSIVTSAEVTITYFQTPKYYTDHNGGGGGGTTNYTDLTNKPKINGVTLSGNKSDEELGLVGVGEKGKASGIATLGEDGKVPASQLPETGSTEYRIVETSSEGYVKAYKLQIKDGEEWSDVVGSELINIPKDMVVESGEVKTVPEGGDDSKLPVGTVYIDLAIAASNNKHIYIPVDSLVNNKAEGIQYSNTTSKLTATTVQAALDEIAALAKGNESAISDINEALEEKVNQTELSSAINDVKTNILSTVVASSNASASNSKTLEFQGTGKNLEKLVIEGKTVQDGTPSPSAPVEVKGVGNRTPNLFNVTAWLNTITGANRGTVSKSSNSITITATADDAYATPATAGDNGFRIAVKPNTSYTLSWSANNNNSGAIFIFYNGNTGTQSNANNNAVKSKSFTTPTNCTFVTLRFGVATSGQSITYSNIMVNEGATALPYEPYGLYKIPISCGGKTSNIYLDQPLYNNNILDTEKGTVYSARKLMIYDGSENWKIGKDLTTHFRFDIAIPVTAGNGPSCMSSYCSWNNVENQTTHFNIPGNTTLTFYINKDDANSLDEWKAMLANNPLMVVYTRQTAIEETFEAPEIATVTGKNTLSINTDVTPTKVEVTSFGEYYSKAEVDKRLEDKASVDDVKVVENKIPARYPASTSGNVNTIKIPNVTNGVYQLVITASDSSTTRYPPAVYVVWVQDASGVLFFTKLAEPVETRGISTMTIDNASTITIAMKGTSYYGAVLRKL